MSRVSLHFLRFILLVVASVAGAAWAQGNPFDGRRLSFTVGSEPGGGYDTYARAIAPHLEKHLPGVTIVVRNDPAGGGVAALRRMARAGSEVDEILMLNTGVVFAQIEGSPEYDGDLATFQFIGKASSEARFLLVRGGAGLASLDAVRNSPEQLSCLVRSGTGTAYVQTKALIDAFGMNARIVTGFRGSEREAALAKGEADCAISSEGNVAALLDAGVLEVLGYVGKPDDPALAALPNFADMAQSEAEKAAVEFVEGITQLGRIVVASPNSDPEEIAILRAAFIAALEDAAFRADAAARNLPLDPMEGEAFQALVERMLKASGQR